MKKVILLAGLAVTGLLQAQTKFEKGYFVDNSGKRSDVLIKNMDWKNNPSEFEFKTDESSDIKKETIANIQEFGVDNEQKYVRKTVQIDTSSDQLNSLSNDSKPTFTEKTVFLKYVVDGKADLLYYEGATLKKFFFSIDDSDVKQLVYKRYYIESSSISYNEDYKKQILENLNCGINLTEVNKLDYKPGDLAKVFLKYNECSNSSAINYNQNYEKRDLFNLTVRPGLNFSSYEISSNYYTLNELDKIKKVSFRIGLEAELILPFNNNKWAVFAEPTFQYFKAENDVVVYPGESYEFTKARSIDYKSIEFPIGIRYYFFLNDKSKIFINASYNTDLQINSNIVYDKTNYKIASSNTFSFGAGYKYNDKFVIEFRTSTKKDLLQNMPIPIAKYSTSSIILGYTLF
ncbi:hypothetical protein [Chryseobacterium profundimaris]|uniref:Outer membrane protein beta-barrel domain-containing protein n=1 Tax=Chryseobacterium profundimaris TaxID=1387275 RepID=A0ABY1P529_9FLAO|nr:hypothetical protein [Chryseobacterium profundimaris]SMP25169.1 hypothetical protein SAMN06264346_108151 [Chryseobacterium profundimaris]